jgi:predicted nucleotidyltransferase component of viral defense system
VAFEARYEAQVRLLMRVLPIVAEEDVFALKGGTAINLFIRDMPRLSVDIDLAYLPTVSREQALPDCRAALQRMATAIERGVPGARAICQDAREDELRVLVREGRCQIKIEVSPVLRGTVFPPARRDVVELVEDRYGFASVQVVSLPDLYGGKICAALDRQHPRDLFDVKLLLDAGEFDREVFLGFIVYLLGHPRPMHEVLQPRRKPLQEVYERELVGMLRTPVALAELEAAREQLLDELRSHLTEADAAFLMSFKRGEPDWERLPVQDVSKLPAVRWKLRNLAQMKPAKHADAVQQLERVLEAMRTQQQKEH